VKTRGLILQPTYRSRPRAAGQEPTPVVQLYGRLESGPAFLVEDDRFRPYFFAPTADAGWLAQSSVLDVSATDIVTPTGDSLVRATANLPGDVPPVRDQLTRRGSATFEADIRFPYRYLSDHNLRAGVEIAGEAESRPSGLQVFRNPELSPCDVDPRLSLLSIDIETSLDTQLVFSVAFSLRKRDGSLREEVHLISSREVRGAHSHSDEATLLIALATRIRELDPDIVTGWNVVDFDLRVLEERATALKLPARLWALGRAPGATRFHRDATFGRQSRAEIPGRVVLDGIPLLRDAIRLEDYRLETAGRHVLGRGKRIDQSAEDKGQEIQRMRRDDPEALAEYNQEDARLVLDILEKEGLVDLAIERSRLTGMQADRVGASVASFDLVYLPRLRERGIAAPSVPPERAHVPVAGGALLTPQPGFDVNVAVFDFKSLYPSLIRTFNLDPIARLQAAEDPITAPNGVHFSRQPGILPEIIERFAARREAARKRADEHASQAIKIMMNSLFGVLGTPSCRFFDPEVANAITSFGQQTLDWTREAFESQGVIVVYGDTDSVFVRLRGSGSAAAEEAEALRASVESAVQSRVREAYRVEPYLWLELDHLYEHFFLPRVRGGRGGSKKRYAGWQNGKLEIVGLESVRRDWPAIAKRLQEGILRRAFEGSEVMPFVRELTEEIRSGARDPELIYVKRIRKGSLESYTSTTPPHIQAARKLKGGSGPVIRYVVTQGGPEPVVPGHALPVRIDYRHYIERVVRPIADAILSELGCSFDEAVGNPTQLSLL